MLDHLIVGGGTAGCVLAARLSERPGARVMLVEAGPDVEPGRVPADITSLFPLSTFNDAYLWPDLRVHWRTGSPAVPMPQGRVLGGGSTVMGMWAMRGRPEDYDEWAARGATGWDWAGVLPYFRRLETDCDFGGPLHGTDVPLPIRRMPRADWPPLARAVAAAVAEQGLAQVDDMNGDFRDGHCTLPVSRYARSRASAGLSYLTQAVRSRPNLWIRTGVAVQRLLMEGRTATGAVLAGLDGEEVVHARETILAAGALASPVLLMRAGIGAAEELRAAAIDPILDRPGVGKGLQTHPILTPLAWLTRSARTGQDAAAPPAATFLRWSSGLPGCPPGDMSLYVRGFLVWHALGRRLAMLAPVLARPHSSGSVRLDPRQPAGRPVVAFDLLSDKRDLARMVAGLRRAAAIFEAPQMRGTCGPAFVLEDAARLARFNRLSRANGAAAAVAALCLDAAPPLGAALLRTVARTRMLDTFVHDDAAAEDYVRSAVAGTYHVAGTCRMGAADDPGAVTDPGGRVRGAEGLRVADASLMPVVPSGNTHVPTVMVAERIAELIKEEKHA